MAINRYRFSAPKLMLTLCLFVKVTFVLPQSILFPGDYFFDIRRQTQLMHDTQAIVHSSLQPFLYKSVEPDTLRKIKYDADQLFDKVFYENLIQVRHTDRSSGYNRIFHVDINPIANFFYGKDREDTATAKVQYNTRGLWLRAAIGKNLRIESAFIENQSFVPVYIHSFGQVTGVVPGQGRWKKFKNGGYDYAASFGVIDVSAGRSMSVRLGHGKQKVGHGYRSLLLSDNAFNYPYAQLIVRMFKSKVQYAQTYAILMNLTAGGARTPPNTEPIFQKKPAAFQHLSWHTGKYFELYFFQGMIWKATDTSNVTRPDVFYINPVMYTNLAKFGFNHANHIIAGSGFQVRPLLTLSIYAQFMYDGNYRDPVTFKSEANWGAQTGIKYYDAFGLKDLFFQCEANLLKGQSYYSTASSYQHYAHYNQLLTTPSLLPGEIIALASYSVKKVFIQIKHNAGFSENSGAAMNYFDARVGYLFNQHYNLNVSVGTSVRSYLSGIPGAGAEEMRMIFVSLRTSLYNLYYDF